MSKASKLIYQLYRRLKKSLQPQITSSEDTIGLMSKRKRYEEGEYIYQNAILRFPDSASFASIYDEVFRGLIYKFNSNNPKPYIIDCGANVGLSLIYFANEYPDAKIIGFEPDPQIFKYLEGNISHFNKKNNVEIVNKGIWNEEGYVSFKMEGADAGRISFDYDKKAFNDEINIETVKLSKYINEPVSLLKLDIEGAEINVLREVEHKLHFVENIFVEYHSFSEKKQELQVILDILSNNDFRYYIDSPTRIRRSPLIERPVFLSFDLLVNIYAYKN